MEGGWPPNSENCAEASRRGAPHLERLHYLKEYLARAKRRPQLVLFEIAGGYDSGPLYQVHQMRFSDRMVAMMEGSSAWWALRWLAGADGLSLFQRFTLGSEILGQLALHVSHVGFFWNSAPVSEAATHDTGALPAPTRFSDVDTAYASVQSNITLLRPYKEKYLAQAVRVRDTVTYSYQRGAASLLDFLNAQSDYRNVNLNYLHLIGAYMTTAGQMNLAVGKEVIP